MTSRKSIQQFHQALGVWYKTHGRKDLPWRHTDDAYKILVSEMMLQQTQVATVLDRYYEPFVQAFPNLSALADADIDAVMKQWQGLGYYRRAGFLHQAAKRSAPTLPNDVNALMALPGIGRNTAHAVLAFAYHQPYPVMEANVKRVLARVFALHQPAEKQLWEHAFELLNTAEPFDYNQAMMDLGAMVCTPKAPACSVCPANNICQGKTVPEAYPAAKATKVVPLRQQQILVVIDNEGKIYATARSGNFLQGLYQFVELMSEQTMIELNGALYEKANWQSIGAAQQVYSHFKQSAEVYVVEFLGKHQPSNWHSMSELAAMPLSKKEQKVLALLAKKYPAGESGV